MAITLRDLTTIDEFRAVVALEKAVWGYTDPEDVVPVPMLVVTVKRGGILIGAFDETDRMVGFVYSVPGFKDGKPMQWSHMLGVIEPYRRGGVGFRLKRAQRERALAMGLDLVEWTFDPLQAPNAHLNFRKLGVIVKDYAENLYGDSSSPLHRGTPTDRFIAEWWIRSPRVEARVGGEVDEGIDRQVADATPVNRSRPAGPWREPVDLDLRRAEAQLAVEIPLDFSRMQQQAPDLALAWRLATRELFTTYFARGYRAVEFLQDPAAGCGRYLLSASAE